MYHTFNELLNKEYLITNEIGGYSSSTFSGSNSRRYHGLLVASFNPPTDRKVLVSKIEEKLIIGDQFFELSSNQYPGVVHPKGFENLKDFGVTNNTAFFLYEHDLFKCKKVVSMKEKENTTIVEYINFSKQDTILELNPLFVFKDYHSLFNESSEYDFYHEFEEDGSLRIHSSYGALPIYVQISKGKWEFNFQWYRKHQLAIEEERGFPYEEDSASIGSIRANLKSGEIVTLTFSTEPGAGPRIHRFDEGLLTAQKSYPPFLNDLEKSSRQFVVQRKSTEGSTIIAGYPWFTDWGRDTMIALRGISIVTGRQQEAKSILETFLKYLDKGMLPNRFPDYNEPLEYNTADATLWLFVALYEYYQQFQDLAFIEEVLPSLKEVIKHHTIGTRYNIKLLESGLLYAGEPGVQLSWMDAKVDGYVVTPRIGCAVEINLLWYNALKIYLQFEKSLGMKESSAIKSMARLFEDSFLEYFLNDQGYLNDVVIPNESVDSSFRPNQIYAISLPFSPLRKKHKQQILDIIEVNLLTDYGLRTLSIEHADFKETYSGGPWNRDTAYHQGTVWPFLWGEWALAYLNLNGMKPLTCLHIWNSSKKLQEHFYTEGCLHGISEIFDGKNPSKGKGCMHQAWSVGMLLRTFLDKNFDFKLIDIE